MKRVAIDTVTLYAGHGGSGGGIWTYTKQLLVNINQQAPYIRDVKFYCFVNTAFDLPLNNMEVIVVGSDTRKLPARMKYLHFSLPQLCKSWKIDLLHRLTPEIPFFIRTPVVATLHDFMAEFYEVTGRNKKAGMLTKLRNKYFFQTKSYALHHSKAVLTPSKAIRNEAINKFGGSAKSVFVTELASLSASTLPSMEKSSQQPIHFFTIAAFHPHKGHEQAIAVFEVLRSAYKLDAYLHFRGNVQEASAFKKIQDRIAISPEKERIKIVGFAAGSTLADIYNKADFVLLLSEYEGFGLPVLEAQSFGIPVICSDIPTFKEVAGDAALFISTKDPALTAQHIQALLCNPNRQKQLVFDGLQNAQKFSWEQTAAKTISVYQACLGSGYKVCYGSGETTDSLIRNGHVEA